VTLVVLRLRLMGGVLGVFRVFKVFRHRRSPESCSSCLPPMQSFHTDPDQWR
jgi:hypothetical protein